MSIDQKYHLKNRPSQELTARDETDAILKKGKFVTLSLCRDNEPYIVTLSYGYDSQRQALYLHTAKEGLKLDFIKSNPAVCATVIEDGGYVPDECSHAYRSVVFWGTIHFVEELEEKQAGMQVLLNHLEEKESVIQSKLLKAHAASAKMEVLRLDIGEIHGKVGY
ncbi:pyridoxamine 5'-phosphate oxidase family protein [Sunxiuqinia sp. sy24]|uniref:pyridoxamine 5'-phosphate oxidase family protein n=1 Tax=Sunxiuqinia sp. sy24 TaxID=3461495 RepID=UPI0040455B08